MPDGAPLHEPIPLSDTAPMSAAAEADLTPSSAEVPMSDAADYDYAQGQYATTAQASYTQESFDESFSQPPAISNALNSAKRLRHKVATQQPRTKAPQPQQTTRSSSSSPQSSTHSSPPSLSKWIKSALGKCHISAASSGVKSSLENAHELAKGNLTAFAHKVLKSTTISVAVSTAISLFKRMLYPLLGYSIASSCLFEGADAKTCAVTFGKIGSTGIIRTFFRPRNVREGALHGAVVFAAGWLVHQSTDWAFTTTTTTRSHLTD